MGSGIGAHLKRVEGTPDEVQAALNSVLKNVLPSRILAINVLPNGKREAWLITEATVKIRKVKKRPKGKENG